ncbi:MAG TPA: DUF1761 domain-containing protein [Bacteroidia bacterium]|nr:DUF1761 domain-containing protein [Bacteroidia bacterium]
MLQINFLAVLVAALVPMVIGFIWYNPKTFGTAWMKAADMTEEKMKGANMALVFGLTFVFSFLVAMTMNFVTIHQFGAMSSMMDMAHPDALKDATQGAGADFAAFMAKYGTNFRTFKHGVFHGTVSGFLMALPIIGVNALFERKGFKYIAINAGFWIVCFALMGGIICAWQ